MSVTASDIVFYGSANMPENSASTSGGAIDLTTKVIFTDIAATDQVTVISSNAGDTTQTVTVYGRDAAGTIVSEPLSLNGTTRVTGAQAFERILKVVVSASHAGTITVTRDNSATFTEIGTLETGVLVLRRLFYDSAADASGGSTRNFYEKIFIKNNNSTTTLSAATVKEQTDPTGNVTFDLEDATNDTNSVANRLSAPSGMLGSFDSSDKTVPGGDLASTESIGVWLKLTLAAGTAAAKSTYTIRLTGTTT
jgi:hypothetical protein